MSSSQQRSHHGAHAAVRARWGSTTCPARNGTAPRASKVCLRAIALVLAALLTLGADVARRGSTPTTSTTGYCCGDIELRRDGHVPGAPASASARSRVAARCCRTAPRAARTRVGARPTQRLPFCAPARYVPDDKCSPAGRSAAARRGTMPQRLSCGRLRRQRAVLRRSGPRMATSTAPPGLPDGEAHVPSTRARNRPEPPRTTRRRRARRSAPGPVGCGGGALRLAAGSRPAYRGGCTQGFDVFRSPAVAGCSGSRPRRGPTPKR